MALTSSINNAIFDPLKTVWGTGEFVGKVIPAQVRTASNGNTPFKISGLALYLSGRNSAVSTAIGIEASTSAFFEVPQSGTPIDTGIKPISYTFTTSPELFDVVVYANGSTNAGVNTYDGINIQIAGSTFSNKTFVGRYEYIQVPAAPTITAIDSITSSSMKISFLPSEDTGAGTLSGYQLQIATSSNFSSGLRVFNISETSHTVTNLDSAKTYYARVLAKNELWAEAQSAGSPWSQTEVAATKQGRSPASSSTGEAFFRYTEPSASNLYSEKVFAEHPLSLWSLDDKSDYISLISEGNRNLALWDSEGGAAQENNLLAAENTFINPSFEASDGTIELRRNIVENPSFEANSGIQEIWRNVYPNSSFSEGTSPGTYVDIRVNNALNPNFEANNAYWTGTPAVTRQTTQIWSGTASGQVVWTALNQSVLAQNHWAAWGADGKSTISVWIKATAGRLIRLAPSYTDKNGANPFEGTGTTFSANGSWQRISIQANYQEASDYYDAIMQQFYGDFYVKLINKTNGANTVYIDGLLVEPGSKLRDYFDGNGYGPFPADPDHVHTWYGTANGSASYLKGVELPYTKFNGSNGAGYKSSTWGISHPGGVASRSIRISPTGSSDSSVSLTGIKLYPETTYTVLGTIRLTQTQVNPSEFARKFAATINSEAVAFEYLSEAPNTVGEHIVRAIFNTGSQVVLNDFRIYNGDDTVDVWWDDLVIVQGVYLGSYFDGRTSPDSDLVPEFKTVTGEITTNLIKNPSFEGGITQWSSYLSSLSSNAMYALYGSNTLQVTPTSSGGGASTQFDQVIGTKYSLSVFIFSESGATATISYDGATGVTGGQNVPVDAYSWTRLVVTGTATSSLGTLKVVTQSTQPFHLDGAQAEVGEFASTYFDGSSSDSEYTYAWTGAVNLSPSTRTEPNFTHGILNGLKPAGQVFSLENGKALISSAWSSSGTKSLKIISTSRIAPARYYATLGSLGLEVGKTYTVLIKTRLSSPQTGTLYNFPTISPSFSFEQFENTSGVQDGRIVFTIDGTDVTLDDELSLYNRATVGNGDVWWDDFLIVEGDYDEGYFDGSSISSNPDITIAWEGTPNISASVQSVPKPLGITNGYQTSEWSMLGQYSLRITDGQTEVIPIAEESTVIITAKNVGQIVTTNLGTYIATQSEQEITLYGVTSLTLGAGDWDNLCIVAGTFLFGYFDGSNPIQNYYSTSWSGVENSSTSLAQPLVTNIFSIGVTEPFADSVTSIVTASDGSSSVRLVSPVFSTWLDINSYMSSLSIGMFVAADNSNLSSIDLGYTGGTNDYLETFEFSVPGQWSYISSQFAEMPANEEYQIVIVFNLIDPMTETNILVNGITAGQWGEEFQLTSLGATKVELPATLGVSEFFGVEAKAYGFQGNNGYYLVNDNLLLARNIGMPMVYGANNITSLFPNPDGGPSLVIPGNGFLNDLGRYRDYTIEFWCRINSGASDPRRIFGPLHSTDGIYVDGPFITLKVGEYVGSHYISEWYRPMLIDLVYGKNVIRLMVDGEVVISIPITASSLTLPAGIQDGINQDWLGFYAYDDVSQVELDSFSIYSYQVPQLVAKRRFVYGQGVEFPETMNVSFNGKSVLVDHTFADYTSSYRYPDIGKWIQGTSENVSIRNNVLSTPEYSLPQIVFNKQSTTSWYEDLSAISDDLIDTITLKPNDSWIDTEGYLLFESLNIVKQDIKAFYGVFQVDGSQIDDEVLFKVEDDATKNYLLITISGNLFNGYDIKYTIRFGANATPEVLLVDHVTTTNETIYAGIDIDRFARKYGKNLSSFFGSPRRLKVYAAGTKEFSKTFSGKISRIGFSTRRNFAKIASLFGVNGILVPEVYDAGDSYFGNDPAAWDDAVDGGKPDTIFFESSLKNHVASYTLFAKKYYENFKLDIATDSYWEDYIPLTYLGKEVLDENGDIGYGLDFMQFNIDYPRTTAKLDGYYDTSESLVKTYVSFQYITTGANQPAVAFDEIIPAPSNGVIDPDAMLDSSASWLNKKFEIVNNTIIYPPSGVDFKKLALVVHLEFETRGILSKSVKIKNLQVSSKALNANQPNKIGTRLGQPIYPYTKYGIYFDYKAKNPYALYRGSTPYLYLTKDSGIKLAGGIDTAFNRGLSVTVNADRASRYRLTAIQAAMLFPNDEFPTIPTPVFELDASTGTVIFLVVSSHPNKKRGTIYAIDKATGRAFSDALFFLNGRFVKNPTISLNEWNMLSVAFMNNIALDGKAGAIRINGPMLFNNFSFYEETALQQARQASLRQWFGVRYSGNNDLIWDYWTPYSWEDVLVLSPNDYDGVNPVELYSTYSGTNKIVVGDDTSLRIDSYKYKIYKDIASTPYIITPL